MIQDEALLGPRNAWSYYDPFIHLRKYCKPSRDQETLGLELLGIVERSSDLDSDLSDEGLLYLLKKLLGLGADVDHMGLTALRTLMLMLR